MSKDIKIALLGKGRTGGRVVDILGPDNVTVFDESNLPTVEKLRGCDVAISFLPGPSLLEHLDTLVESGMPLANGSTGFEWPADIDTRLKQKNVAWITASNFSLGMNLVRGMIKVLGKTPELFDKFEFKLHEIHHIHKKDHPSGTALTWQKWLGHETDITSERKGETIGIHELILSTEFEDISLKHTAKDRKIYAEGAIWTAQKLAGGRIAPGLHELEKIMDKELGL